MTDEQIKQNAEEYAKKIYPYTVGKAAAIRDFIAGAHSIDEEIKELNGQVTLHKDRADYYHDLYMKLRNPWISVEERLPQLNKICFGMRDGKMPRICMLVKKKNGECVFNTPNEEYEYPKGKITHWMPIPQIEKEE